MEKQIKAWLTRYGKSFNDPDFGYSDVDMIDSCCHDLALSSNEDRKLVGKLVDAWILEQR